MLMSQFSITSRQTQNMMPHLIASLKTIFMLIGMVLVIIWEMFPKMISLTSVLLHLFIPHRKYQVKPHSSPWFSAAFAAAIINSNHCFHLHQQNKSSESKVKFRQARNYWKRVLEAAKPTSANKTLHFPETRPLGHLANC